MNPSAPDQHEITTAAPLHREDGTLAEPGFARSLLPIYDRSRIQASAWRRKEWDYYLVQDEEVALCMTIADLAFGALFSVALVDLAGDGATLLDAPQDGLHRPDRPASARTASTMRFLTFGRTGLPSSSAAGDVSFESRKLSLHFSTVDGTRRLRARVRDFHDGHDLDAEVTLTDEPQDSMVLVTPFAEDAKAFYLNQKIVGMDAVGHVTLGDHRHEFRSGDATGLLDWGRGVWTRDNTWYWAAAQGHQDGHRIGFNLGYGFGDTSAASENMFFLDGVAHKLDRVDFGIPGDDEPGGPRYLDDWHVTSNDGRIELTFHPIVERRDDVDLKLVVSQQHQLFGTATGHVVLDDGSRLEFTDLRMMGEKVRNKW